MYNVNLEKVPEGTTRELTFGENAVGVKFNPSFDSEVDEIKSLMAAAIDKMHDLRGKSILPGQKRHASTAITQLEDAQMRMVKAQTWTID